MELFDVNNFKGEVFSNYVDEYIENKSNILLRSKVMIKRPDCEMLYYRTVPITQRNTEASNYDGVTDICSKKRIQYIQGQVVVRYKEIYEKQDFVSDIGGDDWRGEASEIADGWIYTHICTIIEILDGVFSMHDKENERFVNEHTYDITNDEMNNLFSSDTVSKMKMSLKDIYMGKRGVLIMHSKVACNMKNQKFLKYRGEIPYIGLWIVVINDKVPCQKIEALNEGEKPNEDVYAYTTYVLGPKAMECWKCFDKDSYKMYSDEKKGGEALLEARKSMIFAPWGISFNSSKVQYVTGEQLSDGANWALADNESGYFPHTNIPIARIITRG